MEGLGPDVEFPVGITTERWVATDNSGNTDTLTFIVEVQGEAAASPGFDSIANLVFDEDQDPITIQLTGIYDGSDCEVYALDFTLAQTNSSLIDSYDFNYSNNEDFGTLELHPAKDANGETTGNCTNGYGP